MSTLTHSPHILPSPLSHLSHQLSSLHTHSHSNPHMSSHHSQHSFSSSSRPSYSQRASSMIISRLPPREITPRTLPRQLPLTLDRSRETPMPAGYSARWGTPADAPAIANVYFDAFDDSKPRQHCFPEEHRAQGQIWWEYEILNWFMDENYYVRVVTEDATGEIVAFAKWSYHPHGFIAHLESAADAPSAATNADVADHFFKIIDTSREVTHKYTPHIFLSLIGVNRVHQGRKISKMLMRWGIEQADEVKLPIYLESTMIGYPVYRKAGFEEQGAIQYEATLDAPDVPDAAKNFYDWPAMNLVILIRPPGAPQAKHKLDRSCCGKYLQQAWGNFDPFGRS